MTGGYPHSSTSIFSMLQSGFTSSPPKRSRFSSRGPTDVPTPISTTLGTVTSSCVTVPALDLNCANVAFSTGSISFTAFHQVESGVNPGMVNPTVYANGCGVPSVTSGSLVVVITLITAPSRSCGFVSSGAAGAAAGGGGAPFFGGGAFGGGSAFPPFPAAAGSATATGSTYAVIGETLVKVHSCKCSNPARFTFAVAIGAFAAPEGEIQWAVITISSCTSLLQRWYDGVLSYSLTKETLKFAGGPCGSGTGSGGVAGSRGGGGGGGGGGRGQTPMGIGSMSGKKACISTGGAAGSGGGGGGSSGN